MFRGVHQVSLPTRLACDSVRKYPFCLTVDRSNAPAWKQLISNTLTVDEHVALIATIFSDANEVKTVENLSGHDAQAFINIVDRVCPHILLPPKNWLPLNLHTLSVRSWITSHHGSVGSICAFYTVFVATMPCSHSHWQLHPITTQRVMRCAAADLEKCGRANIKARRLQSRF